MPAPTVGHHAAQHETLARELTDLHRSREAFARAERPLTEAAAGEEWCREHGLGETLRSEERQRLLGSPIPTGILYGTGPFDSMYACPAPAGGTHQWGAFYYWEDVDRPYWFPCDQHHVELLDPWGQDDAWALRTFGFERRPADVCAGAFAAAEDGRG